MMVNETFAYTSVLGERQIRVLVIQPCDNEAGEIVCTLEVTQLDNACEYDALSYSWSDREDGVVEFCRVIRCEGCEMLVTKGAHDAIRQFRLPDRVRRLWIDAICIDQHNLQERTQQVSIMAKVYAVAHLVLIWLGDDDDPRYGLHAITVLASLASKHWRLTRSKPVSFPSNGSEMQTLLGWHWMLGRWNETSEAKELPELGKYQPSERGSYLAYVTRLYGTELERVGRPLLDVMAMFLQRRWFGRRWILQETFHARHATMYCGAASMNFEAFSTAIGILSMDTDRLQRVESHRDFRFIHQATHIADLRGSRQGLSAERGTHARFGTPADVLFRYDGFGCSDPRDIVFALLSFHDFDLIAPDYSKDVAEIYHSFARASIDQGDLPKILWQAALRQPRIFQDPVEIPSWAPDWRTPINMSMDSWPTDSEARYGFGATVFDGSFDLHEDGTLVMAAWLAGPIHQHSPPHAIWHCGCRNSRQQHGSPNSMCAYRASGSEEGRGLPEEAFVATVVSHGDVGAGDLIMATHWRQETMPNDCIVLRKAEESPDTYSIVGWCWFRSDERDFLQTGIKKTFRLV